MNKLVAEYFKKIDPLIKPKYWLGDLYKIQIDKIWNSLDEKIKEIMSKDELTELIAFEWASHLFPNIRRYTKKAIANNCFFQATKNDKNKPDFKVGSQWYEITFASLRSVKNKNGFNQEKELSMLIKSKSKLGNWFYKKPEFKNKFLVDLEALHNVDAEDIINRIQKKIKKRKNYLIGNEKVNLIIIFDKPMTFGVRYLTIAIYLFWNELNSTIQKALKSFENIYLMSEGRGTIGFTKPEIWANGIMINKKTWNLIKSDAELIFDDRDPLFRQEYFFYSAISKEAYIREMEEFNRMN